MGRMQSRVAGTKAVTVLLVLRVLENSVGEERKAPASAQPTCKAWHRFLDCFWSRCQPVRSAVLLSTFICEIVSFFLFILTLAFMK